jgi:hypothetical protein
MALKMLIPKMFVMLPDMPVAELAFKWFSCTFPGQMFNRRWLRMSYALLEKLAASGKNSNWQIAQWDEWVLWRFRQPIRSRHHAGMAMTARQGSKMYKPKQSFSHTD